jgi:hypothetical protein
MSEITHGGARQGAGRKPVSEEKSKNALIQKAVNSYYKTETDEEGKEKLIHELLGFERGVMFVAEHLLGKPKEIIEQINIEAKSIPLVFAEGRSYEDLKSELSPE